MLIASIILFLIAAVFGLFILTAVLKNQPTPKTAVVFHGGFVIFALLALVTYIATEQASYLLITGLVLLVLAAIGGFTLLTFDMSNKPIPKFIALLHPLVAVSGVIVLIVHFFQAAGKL